MLREKEVSTEKREVKHYLSHELMQEVKQASPGSRLSLPLRINLERYSVSDRREIVAKVEGGCAPLFVACRRGNVETVEYLVVKCHANIEQRGVYEVPEDRSVHYATPLWCAAVSGKLSVVKRLVQLGADVNASSDTGSTAVRSACFMTHIEIVTYLVESGADILKSNHSGGTCLINSIQNIQLCTFLLEHGASVNASDIQNKTALHYAISEHRTETTKLLLRYGADPFLKSICNDDALQTACLKGDAEIFHYLINTIEYPPSRIADAYELLGSTFLDEQLRTQLTLQQWRMAINYRKQNGEDGKPLPKLPHIPPSETFNYAEEFTTEKDLEMMAYDVDALKTQSLLICERVLGGQHKDTLFRLMYRGAAYADDSRFQCCINLWRKALELRVAKDSVLFSDTCFTAQALVRQYFDLNERSAAGRAGCEDRLRFKDVLATFYLLTDRIPDCQRLLSLRPVFKRQQESYDRILKCITYLIYLMVEMGRCEEKYNIVYSAVKKLVQLNPHSVLTGDTILHLFLSRMNTIKSTFYFLKNNQLIFPNIPVINLLIECGAPINARNFSHSTPLHIAAKQYNFDAPTVQLLLDSGAHLDMPNKKGETPANLIVENTESTIALVPYISLQCLAATVIVKNRIPYVGEVSVQLENFVRLHGK
ncbi:protein fem-1 homolog CG6966 [Nilaparvata lugens]|uniref:protein fem-1 homolog CG6966 n=1 Tax=Nilaparvata lugens TaxID=108931 RepID=UPI000B98E1B2|nr:protein fem-1 homolog CG6966 [Nilaparvata lugens]XP_022199877.1 protein fem-1 homolog CG6966 [Nilaparvata lugens]